MGEGIWTSRPTIREICLPNDRSAKQMCMTTSVKLMERDCSKEVLPIRFLTGKDGTLQEFTEETVLEVKGEGNQEAGALKGSHQWEPISTPGPERAGLGHESYRR